MEILWQGPLVLLSIYPSLTIRFAFVQGSAKNWAPRVVPLLFLTTSTWLYLLAFKQPRARLSADLFTPCSPLIRHFPPSAGLEPIVAD